MNRPIITDYVFYENTTCDEKYPTKIIDFVQDLNDYCDELEEDIRGGHKLDRELMTKNLKLEKALDEACIRLESFDKESQLPPDLKWSKEKWKEWCLLHG